MKSTIVIFIGIFFFFISCCNQKGFGQNTPLEQTREYYPSDGSAFFDIVYQSDSLEAISVRYFDNGNPLIYPRSTPDWVYDYVFFKKENGIWTHQQTTAYSFPEATIRKNSLEHLTEDEADSISRDFPWGDLPYFFSREDFKYKQQQSILILAHDTTMIDYFKNNTEQFEELRKQVLKIPKEKPEHRWVFITEESSVSPQLINLLLTDVQAESEPNETVPYRIWFNITGERFHNAVGYLFCPDEKERPNIGNKEIGFILTIPIENGWYLFKCL